MNQPVAFGLLLAGGILLVAGFTGDSLAQVVQGKATSLPSGSHSLGSGSTDLIGSAQAGGYVNPLAAAKVTPERIDQGVDYAGSGNLVAIGRAKVTQVNPSGWGKFGAYIEYQLLDGPLAGRYVYYAEGVQSHVHVGQVVNAGDPIASLIPHWASGIEIGFSSGRTNQAYASALGGGYKEGQLTAAGKAFSDLIAELGGQAGQTEGRQVSGSFR